MDLQPTHGGLDGDAVRPDPSPRQISVGSLDELSLNAGSLGSQEIVHLSTASTRSWAGFARDRRAHLRGIRRMPGSSNGLWPSTLTMHDKGKARATKPLVPAPIVYKNVCFDSDPPISVAVSATRPCVAFGSVKGVELYWVDTNTGQNMNRWFALTRASDHLYFLPPRREVDSPQKLRLISSAVSSSASKGEVASIQSTGSTWFSATGPWRFPWSHFRKNTSFGDGHSHAVPLSDGYHILFTDDETGLLCIGSDEPAGSAQRLSRKLVFEPPKRFSNKNGDYQAPMAYTAAYGLEDGVRVAASYGQQIVLFTVPIDVLRYSTAEQEETLQPLSEPFSKLDTAEVLRHPTSNAVAIRELADIEPNLEQINIRWVHWLPASGDRRPSSQDEIWPLRIQGAKVGDCEFVPSAVSVQAGAAIAVWAFGKEGRTKLWCG